MKRSIPFFLLICFVFAGCGKDSTTARSGNSSNGLTDNWLAVTITIPPYNSLGGAKTVSFSNKAYLIGSQTDSRVMDYINGLPSGTTFSKELKGMFAKEDGRFPNPTVEYDVIHIQVIR